MISKVSDNAISSPELADGHSHCVAQAGPMIVLHGQHHALANLSARQAKDLGLLTSGTYGPPHIGLSASAALSWYLASNLEALTRATGSTLFKLTWKPWAMPSGRLRFRLRASARRTSETVLIGWPTPLASNGRGAGNFKRQGGGEPSNSSIISRMDNTKCDRWSAGRIGDHSWNDGQLTYADGENGSMANADDKQRPFTMPAGSYADVSRQWNKNTEAASGCGSALRPGPLNGFWRDADWLSCQDGKWRPVVPGSFPLANGVPARVGRLRTYGNAINVEAATAFIKAYMATVSYV